MQSVDKDKELTTQYNSLADDFYALEAKDPGGQHHREHFYSRLDFIEPGARLLDLGCGGGLDLAYYGELGAEIHGIDASDAMVESARLRLPGVDIRVGLLHQIPFPSEHFDIVLSKYTLQSVADVTPVFREIHRVLKPGGVLMYLAVHPFRQFFERRQANADYFTRTVVETRFFNGQVTVREPTHTMNDYLSEYFLSRFDIDSYIEDIELAAERVGNQRYPGFFIVRAKKRA